MYYHNMLFSAHERFLIGREPHGISAIYLIIFIYQTFRPLSLRSHRPLLSLRSHRPL